MKRERTELGEWEMLTLLERVLVRPKSGRVFVGIGDDCAVLALGGEHVVWTTDACLENAHFRREWLSPADIAWKSLHAAVSDVAAMGATPVGALCHLTVPRDVDAAWLRKFALGQRAASKSASCPIIGGNLARGERFDVVTTALGSTGKKSPLLRSGARPGDEVWLAGELGRARLGLELLRAGRTRGGRAERACLARFRRPEALVAVGPKWLGRATACLDVSDGLVGDAEHLARSSGVSVVLSSEALLATADDGFVRTAWALGLDPLDVVLFGGEDYALLGTGPKARRPRGARVIGRVERGRGVWLNVAGRRERVRGGFEHGAPTASASRARRPTG